mgnify:CR=1 FL=1
MSKAVMLSIRPKWAEKIANGEKTIEVRKTRPKLDTPFKCYIYCTLQGCNEFFRVDLGGDVAKWNRGKWADRKGKIIGEFTCDRIYELETKARGGKVSLVLCDDEGNLHDEAYREHPYSGLGFMLHHAHEENPECPIASYECDGGILGGVHIYDTEEQAAEAWNRRTENG